MNDWKSILLHLDASPAVAHRVNAAQRIASAHGAGIEALYAVLPTMLQFPYAFAADAQAVPVFAAFEAEQRDRVKAQFDKDCAAAGAVPMRWSETSGEPVRAFTRRAWGADLLVLGQSDPEAKGYPGVPPDFNAAVLIDSGKPGLLVPYIGAGKSLGETVLIAWKPTRESARAVTAALPMLARAARVHVATWEEETGEGAPAAPDIEPWLRAHGIAATLHRGGPPTRDLGELLLSLATDLQADVIVMGCYGHGRAREWVLGGVTRTVLVSSPIPLFLVH